MKYFIAKIAIVLTLVGANCPMVSAQQEVSIIGEYESNFANPAYIIQVSCTGTRRDAANFQDWLKSLPNASKLQLVYKNLYPMNLYADPNGEEADDNMQYSVAYNYEAASQKALDQLTESISSSQLPLSLNVMQVTVDPETRKKLREEGLKKATEAARQQIAAMNPGKAFKVTHIEELEYGSGFATTISSTIYRVRVVGVFAE